MNRKLIYGLVVLAALFFIVSLIVFFNSRRSERPGQGMNRTGSVDQEQESESGEPLAVKFFFYTADSPLLVGFDRRIEGGGSQNELYRRFLTTLLEGQSGCTVPLPPGAGLRSLYYLEKPQMLVVDFNENLINAFPGGTRAELEFIFFIVDNLCFNFQEIKKVKFLVGGNEQKTVAGHIDIAKPFFPNYSYIKAK